MYKSWVNYQTHSFADKGDITQCFRIIDAVCPKRDNSNKISNQPILTYNEIMVK